jgi:hypothetical protein
MPWLICSSQRASPTEALNFAERTKARALLDVLRQGRINVQKAMTPPEQGTGAPLESGA